MKTNFTFDAQAATSFIVSQSTHVEQQVNETVYPDIQYPGLIPVDTSANPFTQTVTFYSSDMFGRANWINGNSDDIPLAGTERSQFKSAVYTAGIGYGYGWEEVNVAMRDGVNLTADDAKAARRAYEEMVDDVAMIGDARKGFLGLVNSPAITPVAATNGDWTNVARTADQILADVNQAILGIPVATKYTSIGDTLLMSPERMNLLATKRLGDTTMTVLELLRMNNTYTAMTSRPLVIRPVRALTTAGAGGIQRMVSYRRDPNVLKLHMPMPHRFMPVFQDGPLHWIVPGVFRLGGVDIRRPAEVRYIDGI